MPVPLKAPERIPWKGGGMGFGTADQRELLKQGHPFLILDAKADFGERKDIALVVQLCNQLGAPIGDFEAFVFTLGSSPSRLKLVEQVREVSHPQDGPEDSLGPVQIRRVPAKDPGKSEFMRIVNVGEGPQGDEIPF